MAVSKRLRYEVLKRDNNTCRYCGGRSPDVVLTIDHVVPVALGGGDAAENLVAACKDCNSGKSSVPADAPLVADVADDALRWARAMEMVAERRGAERLARQQLHDAFEEHWNSWTFRGKWLTSGEYERVTAPLPGGWRTSVEQFINAGLELDDLAELIDVAMGSNSNNEWKYFCGCCWRRVTENQEMAKALVAPSIQDERENAIMDELDRLECVDA